MSGMGVVVKGPDLTTQALLCPQARHLTLLIPGFIICETLLRALRGLIITTCKEHGRIHQVPAPFLHFQVFSLKERHLHDHEGRLSL